MWFQKLSIPPQGWVLGLNPPTPWNLQFSFILSFKKFWLLIDETLLPSEFPMTILGLGVEILWKCTLSNMYERVTHGSITDKLVALYPTKLYIYNKI